MCDYNSKNEKKLWQHIKKHHTENNIHLDQTNSNRVSKEKL